MEEAVGCGMWDVMSRFGGETRDEGKTERYQMALTPNQGQFSEA